MSLTPEQARAMATAALAQSRKRNAQKQQKQQKQQQIKNGINIQSIQNAVRAAQTAHHHNHHHVVAPQSTATGTGTATAMRNVPAYGSNNIGRTMAATAAVTVANTDHNNKTTTIKPKPSTTVQLPPSSQQQLDDLQRRLLASLNNSAGRQSQIQTQTSTAELQQMEELRKMAQREAQKLAKQKEDQKALLRKKIAEAELRAAEAEFINTARTEAIRMGMTSQEEIERYVNGQMKSLFGTSLPSASSAVALAANGDHGKTADGIGTRIAESSSSLSSSDSVAGAVSSLSIHMHNMEATTALTTIISEEASESTSPSKSMSEEGRAALAESQKIALEAINRLAAAGSSRSVATCSTAEAKAETVVVGQQAQNDNLHPQNPVEDSATSSSREMDADDSDVVEETLVHDEVEGEAEAEGEAEGEAQAEAGGEAEAEDEDEAEAEAEGEAEAEAEAEDEDEDEVEGEGDDALKANVESASVYFSIEECRTEDFQIIPNENAKALLQSVRDSNDDGEEQKCESAKAELIEDKDSGIHAVGEQSDTNDNPFETSEVASSERFAEDSENTEKKDSDSGSTDIDHDTEKSHEEEEEEVEEDNHDYSADFALFEMVPKVESMFSVDDDMANLFDFVQGGGDAAANEALEGNSDHELSADGGSGEMDEKLRTNHDDSEEKSFEHQEVEGGANDAASVQSEGTEEKVQVSKESREFDVDKTPPRRNISSEKKAEILQSDVHNVLDASRSDGILSNEGDDVSAGGSDLLFVGSDLKTDSISASFVTNEYSEEETDNDEAAHWWNDDDTDCSVHPDEEHDVGAKLQSPSRNQTLLSTAARGRRQIVDSQLVSFKRSFPRLPPPEAPESPEKLLFTISRKYTFEKVSWFQPPPHLEELIKSANDDSIARRSNACGVLKIMSSKKENHSSLARTAGVLDALIFVARESCDFDTDAAVDSRSRAMNTISNLAASIKNRTLLIHHPRMLTTLIAVIKRDYQESRVFACSTLAYLAKTEENKRGLAEADGLLTILSWLLGGNCIGPFIEENIISDREALSPVLDNENNEITSKGDIIDSLPPGKDSAGITKKDRMTIDECDARSEISSASAVSKLTEVTGIQSHESKDENKHEEKVHRAFMKKYKKKSKPFLLSSRSNACAIFLHLAKHRATAGILCANTNFMAVLVRVCNEVEVPIHTKCIEILFHLSRVPMNIMRLAESEGVLSTLQRMSKANEKSEDRLFAIRTAQNLSCELQGRQALTASSFVDNFPQLLCGSNSIEEQAATVSTVLNLCIDSESIVFIASKPGLIAALVHLCTHESDSLRDIACDALAVISYWFQKFASNGIVPADIDFQDAQLPTDGAYAWEQFLSGI